MSEPMDENAEAQRRAALSRWDNEGGAEAEPPPLGVPPLGEAELIKLRVRVIALENLLLALLTSGSDRQLQAVRDMAIHLAPRQGFTQHPLTLQAAAQMNDLASRADILRGPRTL